MRWRLAYRYNGKQKTLAIGVYPTTSLQEARDARDDARRLLCSGQDPSLFRKLAKAAKATASANTFNLLADELPEKKRAEGKAERTFDKVEWLLNLARPDLGERPIAEIVAPEVLRVLKTVEARGRLETAKRLRATIGQVFRFAVATGRGDTDPTASLRAAVASPVVQHRAAIIEPKAFGGLLRAIAIYEGSPETKAALELSALTFTRPGEVRAAEWSEIDLDGATWSIPAAKMKMRRPHRIPLAPRAVTLLRELHGITGNGRFVFPSNRSREHCMSENTINAALRRLGFTNAACGTQTPSSVSWLTSITIVCGALMLAPTIGMNGSASWTGGQKDAGRWRRAARSSPCGQSEKSSAQGVSLQIWSSAGMSALVRIADSSLTSRNVRYVPNPEIRCILV